MLREAILHRLQEIQQPHLGLKLHLLNEGEQKQFLDLLQPELLKSQREMLKPIFPSEPLDLVLAADTASSAWTPLGFERLRQGKVACLILAGGQGTRLGLSIPKALVPISLDGKKTLLEFQLDKIAQACQLCQLKIPCAMITSVHNNAMIAQFLKEKKGDLPLTLVVQNEAPFLDDQGNWMLREDGQLATGPDGNGYALHLLGKMGILKQWKEAGVEDITVVPIDNPLADPVDAILIGYHAAHSADVTVKVISRQDREEKVGIMVRRNHKIQVREYSELPPDMPGQACLAYIGLFALTLSFAEHVAQQTFPWHLARKQDPITHQMIWKFERFIFDMLEHAVKTNLLLYPRQDVYAPLKNASGEKSKATVQAALQRILAL